jgi:hypothetical protein
MSVTFLNLENWIRIREPLTEKIRAIYRGPRNSYYENLETGLILNDLDKVANELNTINEKKEIRINTFGSVYQEVDQEDSDFPKEGFSEKYDEISLFFGEFSQEYNPIELDSLAKVSSNLFRISQKVKRLEIGNSNG